MRTRRSWFSSWTKALVSESKRRGDHEGAPKSKAWFRRRSSVKLLSSHAADPATPVHPIDEVKSDDREKQHSYSAALATAAEAAAAAAEAAAEVVRLTNASRFYGEEAAAVRIQTVFRGYLARRALRALRGLVRLKTMIQSQSVQRQTASAIHHMHTLSRALSQIHIRRLRVAEKNQLLQRQLQKRERELEKLRSSVGDSLWDDSTQSKEKVDDKIQSRHDAAARRERALAYAYSHKQWQNAAKPMNAFFTHPNNPQWGWSWLERWVGARPSDSPIDKEPINDRSSVWSSTSHPISTGEIMKSYARRNLNSGASSLYSTSQKQSRLRNRDSPSTPPPSLPSLTAKRTGGLSTGDDDSRSVQPDRRRRHTIAVSPVRDDESLASSPSVPSYMTSTESARAKTRPLGLQKNPGSPLSNSAKKKLLFSGPSSSSAPRRHSGPPRVDVSPIRTAGLPTDVQ